MPASRRRSALHGINHPLLTRISPTNYLLCDVDYPVHTTVHVGQITDYVRFDERLRAYGDTTDFHSIPIGYTDFCTAWNNGTADNDHRRFSTIFLAEDPQHNSVIPSTRPVKLCDFHITPAQAGNTSDVPAPPADPIQAKIAQEYATIMAFRQKKQ